MEKERCISIKKSLIEYIETNFPEFTYEGGTSSFYAFVRKSENGIHDYILIERAFYNGEIHLIMQVYLTSQMGSPIPVKVTAKDDKMITFDANHEMAGKELNFTIELVEVK